MGSEIESYTSWEMHSGDYRIFCVSFWLDWWCVDQLSDADITWLTGQVHRLFWLRYWWINSAKFYYYRTSIFNDWICSVLVIKQHLDWCSNLTAKVNFSKYWTLKIRCSNDWTLKSPQVWWSNTRWWIPSTGILNIPTNPFITSVLFQKFYQTIRWLDTPNLGLWNPNNSDDLFRFFFVCAHNYLNYLCL